MTNLNDLIINKNGQTRSMAAKSQQCLAMNKIMTWKSYAVQNAVDA